jgi:hypothetical protein
MTKKRVYTVKVDAERVDILMALMDRTGWSAGTRNMLVEDVVDAAITELTFEIIMGQNEEAQE